ncbi:MAG TPA: YggS family pyridoxal phosphate-dependent enzyme [Jatrophihabitantaceae bacterium]
MSAPLDPDRRAELVAGLAGVRGRLAAACEEVGRDPRAITLVAVTKTFPASDVASLATLGVTDIGENRDQEAKAKVAEVAASAWDIPPLTWHFVGRLQTNKARSVARYAQVVHSVDRAEVATALAAGAERAERNLDVFAQVSLDDDPARGGVLARDLGRLADHIAGLAPLRLLGLMAVAPLRADPDEAFERLAAIAERLRADHPDAVAISAGMSADLEPAVRHGATHVRVGSALLGRRPPIFG